MKFSIVVYTSPASSEAAASALRFTNTLLQEGHEIYRLFFFSDGVQNVNRFVINAQDEINLPQRWQQLIANYELDSVACVSSAIRRGVINAEEAERYELDAVTLQSGTEIAGLGQLVDAAIHSDRLVQFG